MSITFYKYQGTGNDFIMIDNRQQHFSKNDTKLIKQLCDRKFGIGADGLILLENHQSLDFTMVYYNSDGNTSSMCGNGGRCLVSFARDLGIVKKTATFEAIDGVHEAHIEDDLIHLKMQDVSIIIKQEDHLFLDTGSPHHIEIVDKLKEFDVKSRGAAIRYSGLYGEEGSNVNFVEQKEGDFAMRTYERGVEDETLSCGTGATAVALAMHYLKNTTQNKIQIQVEGGTLCVSFEEHDNAYENIYLIGPAQKVFKGIWER